MSPIVICRPDVFLHRRILHCPTCERRRRFAVRDTVWYGPTVTCCGCGDSWGDGERMPRPFRRGWRNEAIAKAKRDWDAAGPYDREAHRRWLEEQIGPAGSEAAA